jgi:hypothetical protein
MTIPSSPAQVQYQKAADEVRTMAPRLRCDTSHFVCLRQLDVLLDSALLDFLPACSGIMSASPSPPPADVSFLLIAGCFVASALQLPAMLQDLVQFPLSGGSGDESQLWERAGATNAVALVRGCGVRCMADAQRAEPRIDGAIGTPAACARRCRDWFGCSHG